MFSLLLLLASRACRSANPAIEANDLGINAAKCADTYCTSKDSLDLWLSIAKDCYSEAGDGDDDTGGGRRRRRSRSRRLKGKKKKTDDGGSDDDKNDDGKEEGEEDTATLTTLTTLDSSESIAWGDYTSSSSGGYPRWVSGLICSLLGTLGMVLGLLVGRRSRSLPHLDLSKTRAYVVPLSLRKDGDAAVMYGSPSLADRLRDALAAPFRALGGAVAVGGPRYAPVPGYEDVGINDSPM